MPRAFVNGIIYLWAAPNTLLGLLGLVLASIGGRVKTRVVDGVLEVYGGSVAVVLSDYTLLPGGASAITFGHVVFARSQRLLDQTRRHERVHVRQCERWGPLFVPAYLLASAAAWARGGRAYEDNPFEREAYTIAD